MLTVLYHILYILRYNISSSILKKKECCSVYLTIEETAEFLSMPEQQVRRYVLEGRIKSVHDGEQYLINQTQFDRHL
ncbi:helix-turn-helix domain-containing protein, partial [Leptospira santarosai]|nr:helix-turn-helix domain-containing protein [Leptospira santarosai]